MKLYTKKVIFLKCPIFAGFFSHLYCKNFKVGSHGNEKNGNIKRKKLRRKKRINDLSVVLDNHGRRGLISYFNSLPISGLRNFESEANKFYNRA